MVHGPELERGSPIGELEANAATLAAKFPELLVEAQHAAQTVSHGTHGRRRSGPGETFWQFRRFETGDTAGTIDWRRSAGSDHLFVREREWEAAHSVWIWLDTLPSMGFRSHLSRATKAERAIVLGLAIAELLARAGERVGLLGGQIWSGRRAAHRLAEALARELATGGKQSSLPARVEVNAFSECLLIGDFLEPVNELAPKLEQIAKQGVRGHLVQVLDPAEELLPYEGHTEFVSSKGGERIIAGRAESLRKLYRERLLGHRRSLMEMANRLNWSFLLHHSDCPAEHALLALHTRMAGLEGDYRYRESPGSQQRLLDNGTARP